MPAKDKTDLFPEDTSSFSLDERELNKKKEMLSAIETQQKETLEQIDALKTRLNSLFTHKAYEPREGGHDVMLAGLHRDLKAIQDKIAGYNTKLSNPESGTSPHLRQVQEGLNKQHLQKIEPNERMLVMSIESFKQMIEDYKNRAMNPQINADYQQDRRQKLYEDYFGQPKGKFYQINKELTDKLGQEYINKLKTTMHQYAYENHDDKDLLTLIDHGVNKKGYQLKHFLSSSPTVSDTVFNQFKKEVHAQSDAEKSAVKELTEQRRLLG